MQENFPSLVAIKPLEIGFEQFQKILITSEEFSLGRGRSNTVIIPYLSISRNHCVFRKTFDSWTVEDTSSLGIDINGIKLGKGNTKKLENGDRIELEPAFVFQFMNEASEDQQPLTKRIKLEDKNMNKDFINDMKIKFEESQNCEMRHIADKIYNTQQRQSATKQLKEHIKKEYQKKLQQLECEFSSEIFNLQGSEQEINTQKVALEKERDIQLAAVRREMEDKIAVLMQRISHETDLESTLIMENNILKEKLRQEREEFLAELNRETSSKQLLLQNLEIKIKEQEVIRVKERQELERQQRLETEQLKAVKENELKELAEQKIRREEELLQELSYIKENLEGQVEQMELQRCHAEEQLIIQMNEMKKINEEDKEKMKQLILERQSIENKMYRAQQKSEIELKKLKAQVSKREVELAALASERIQKQAEQSSEVINSLQAQLEKVKNQLESVQNEKNELLACIPDASTSAEKSSKQSTLAEVGELMENELQCSICAELFVNAITLNCSHTFCKYCITVWKRKKTECPICRTPITSECKSLVLDSFIDKMVQNLTDDMKQKRAELLKNREVEVVKMNARSSRKACPSSQRHRPPNETYRIYRRRRSTRRMAIPSVDLTGIDPDIPVQLHLASANALLNAVPWGMESTRETNRRFQERIVLWPDRSGNTEPLNEQSTSHDNGDIEFIED